MQELTTAWEGPITFTGKRLNLAINMRRETCSERRKGERPHQQLPGYRRTARRFLYGPSGTGTFTFTFTFTFTDRDFGDMPYSGAKRSTCR
jgi:hypothetical protein